MVMILCSVHWITKTNAFAKGMKLCTVNAIVKFHGHQFNLGFPSEFPRTTMYVICYKPRGIVDIWESREIQIIGWYLVQCFWIQRCPDTIPRFPSNFIKSNRFFMVQEINYLTYTMNHCFLFGEKATVG